MNSLLGLNIIFENLLDDLHNRMKFQVIWVGFLYELLAYIGLLIMLPVQMFVRQVGVRSAAQDL